MNRSEPTLDYASTQSPRRKVFGQAAYSIIVALLLAATLVLYWPELGWGRCVLLKPFLENPKQHYWQDLVVRELWRQLGWVSRISLVSGVVMAMYSCLPGKCRPLWFWAALAANTMMFGLYLGQAY